MTPEQQENADEGVVSFLFLHESFNKNTFIQAASTLDTGPGDPRHTRGRHLLSRPSRCATLETFASQQCHRPSPCRPNRNLFSLSALMLLDTPKYLSKTMQCNAILRVAHKTARGAYTRFFAHNLRPRCLMQLAIPMVPGGRPRDSALPQGRGSRAHPLPRPAAGQAPPEQARWFIIVVAAAAAAAVVAVAPEVQGGAERAPLAPRVGPAVLQAVPLDFVEQEIHLALHAEDVARAGLLDLLVADAPPAVLLLLLGRLDRMRGGRGGSI